MISRAWAWLVASWPLERGDVQLLVGVAALLYGVALVAVPAAWILGGGLLVVGWVLPRVLRQKGS